MLRTVAVLLLIFVVLAVAWGLTNDPVEEPGSAPVAEATAADPLSCTAAGRVQLPDAIRESSGVAVDPATGVLWSHNDSGGEPAVYGFDEQGRLIAAVAVQGAQNIDWEDIALAPCGEQRCLLIGDIGDNDAERERITLYRTPIPEAGMEQVTATPIHARYPDGPRDAEALLTTRGGGVYLVTKGRDAPIDIYEVGNVAEGTVASLRQVRTLGPEPDQERDRVTAASASPDGQWLAIRTYAELRVYSADALLTGTDVAPRTFDLRTLQEPQGEGVAIGDQGTVWVTSEGDGDQPPAANRLDCILQAAES